MIGESVRTNGSQYDITPPARPNHPFEDIPEGDNLSWDFYAANQEETSNPFNSDGQPCDLILQLQYPWPIFNEDNSWGDKLKCFSGDRNATSYSVCGTLWRFLASKAMLGFVDKVLKSRRQSRCVYHTIVV